MKIENFSANYRVRMLTDADVPQILALCSENTLYYQHCPPFVSASSILHDLRALPPGKTPEDKFYIGYFDGGRLAAVMDFIRGYPDSHTAFIGFFMVDAALKNAGTGSGIIGELCAVLPAEGMDRIRLGWVKGNPQSEHFWKKQGFAETGTTPGTGTYTVVMAEKHLTGNMAAREHARERT